MENSGKGEQAMKSFAVPMAMASAVQKLSDADAGVLFKAAFTFAETGEASEIKENLELLFDVLCGLLTEQREKAAQNRENGKKGGRPRTHEKAEKSRAYLGFDEGKTEKPHGYFGFDEEKSAKPHGYFSEKSTKPHGFENPGEAQTEDALLLLSMDALGI
jgi:hypothetical protein